MEKTVIAVAGKGGVGKTSFSAAVVRQLVREHPNARILAIDADPAVGLETALGVHADYTVDDIRKEITASGEEDTAKVGFVCWTRWWKRTALPLSPWGGRRPRAAIAASTPI
ncbi:MAG: ArsA-related P-loop ATPase [Ruthenibacterium sp.]